jgi:ubiquinone biosynthesis protein UbiJ
MIFAAVNAIALSGLETTINVALKYDQATHQKLQHLDQKVLLIDCVLPSLQIAIEPSKEGVMLHENWQGEPAITLSGSLVALTNLAINSRDSGSFAESGVKVSGNLEALRQYNDILTTLDIDWEAALAELLGDIPAHIIGDVVRKTAKFSTDNRDRATSALREISQEEFKLTPSSNEYQTFKQGVRQLASDTDRLMAKVQQFKAQLELQLKGKSV